MIQVHQGYYYDEDYVPCSGDRLEIYGNSWAEELGCLEKNIFGKYIVSDSNNMTLRFVTDEEGHREGFEILFEETWEGNCQCGPHPRGFCTFLDHYLRRAARQRWEVVLKRLF